MTHAREDYAQGPVLDRVHDAVLSDAKAVLAAELRILGAYKGLPCRGSSSRARTFRQILRSIAAFRGMENSRSKLLGGR